MRGAWAHPSELGFVQMTKGRAGAASMELGEQEWGWRSRHYIGEGGICSHVFSIFPGNFCISESRERVLVSPCWVVGIFEEAARRHT